MLNGHSLEKVIKSCAPGVKNVKKLMLPEEVAEVVFAQTKKFQSLKIKSLILTRKVY
jgi:hypothetical protein